MLTYAYISIQLELLKVIVVDTIILQSSPHAKSIAAPSAKSVDATHARPSSSPA